MIESWTTGKATISNGAERRAFAGKLLAFLDGSVSARERRAVKLCDAGTSFEQIAKSLNLKSPGHAERLVARARDHLHYRRALELWCGYFTAGELADHLGLAGAAHANRVVKAAKAFLRRRFAAPGVSL